MDWVHSSTGPIHFSGAAYPRMAARHVAQKLAHKKASGGPPDF
jgi:hypothetical protein